MHCPHCGASFPEGARFCRNCGTPLVEDQPTQSNRATQGPANGPVYEAPYATRAGSPRPPEGYVPNVNAHAGANTYGQPYPSAHPSTGPTAGPGANPNAGPNAPTNAPRSSRKGPIVGVIIAIVALLAILTVGIVSCSVITIRNATTATHAGHTSHGVSSYTPTMHPVTFTVNIAYDGYDTTSSRFPVRITGTDADGNKVDKTVFLAYSGADVELMDGEYEVEALGSAICTDGTIFKVPTGKAGFIIDEYVGENESYTVSSSGILNYMPLTASEMTDELVNDAISWARKDEQSGADVGTLEKAIEKRRAEATSNETGSNTDSTGANDSAAAPEANAGEQNSAQPEAEAKPEDKPSSKDSSSSTTAHPDKGIG